MTQPQFRWVQQQETQPAPPAWVLTVACRHNVLPIQNPIPYLARGRVAMLCMPVP